MGDLTQRRAGASNGKKTVKMTKATTITSGTSVNITNTMRRTFGGCCCGCSPSSSTEEVFNVLTHAAAIPLAVYVVFSLLEECQSILERRVASIYGTCLIGQFVISSLYHGVCWKFGYDLENFYVKAFQLCDRSMIFFLIASSYTPFLLVMDVKIEHMFYFNVLFYLVWLQAFLGTIYTLFFDGTLPSIELYMYIVMAGCGILLASPLYHNAPESVVPSLIAGVASYFIGTLFYSSEMPYGHAIWHLFVVGGALFVHLGIIFLYIHRKENKLDLFKNYTYEAMDHALEAMDNLHSRHK